MKKLIAFVLAAIVLILSLNACSIKNSTGLLESEANTQSSQQTTTVQLTTAEQATEVPNEQINSAYLKYLEDNSKWFTDPKYNSKSPNCNISFIDLNGDGVEELIHTRPNNMDSQNNVYLTVLTYDSGLNTIYDQPLFCNSGSEAPYSVFIADDSKIYSVVLKSGNQSIMRYNYNSGKFTSEVLGEETGGDYLIESNNSFTVNGKKCTPNEFSKYKDKILNSADTLLIYSAFDDYTVKDNSMSYEEACKHVGSTVYDIEWKKLYLQTLNGLDDSQFNGYMLAFINEDDIPELLAVANSKATQSRMYWVFDKGVYDDKFALNNLFYLEKKNTFLFRINNYPIRQDNVNKIENNKIVRICNGEINTLEGKEYYKWNDKDLGSLDKYNQELNTVISETEAKTVENLKSFSEIVEIIKKY